jgi:hypothetical protein
MPAESKDSDVRAIITLYQRCEKRNVLPNAGGILEQPEDIMNYFDVIDEEIAKSKRKHALQVEEDEITARSLRGI